MLESCKLILTFESVEEIPWCYHSNEFSSAVFSRSAIYMVRFSNVWVCEWNPMVLPFKWSLFSSIFTWCYLFFFFVKWGNFVELWLCPLLEVKQLINWPNSGLGSKRQSVNQTLTFKTTKNPPRQEWQPPRQRILNAFNSMWNAIKFF